MPATRPIAVFVALWSLTFPPQAVAQDTCNVVFGISEPAALTGYFFNVEDTGGPGSFPAPGGLANCFSFNPAVTVDGIDLSQPDGKTLLVSINTSTPILTDGIDLGRCIYNRAGGPTPPVTQFTVTASLAVNGPNLVNPPPAGEVRRVTCGVVTTTTTTTTTLSTLSTTTTSLPGGNDTCDITFAVRDSVDMAAFTVEFTSVSAPGSFVFSTEPGTDMLGGVCTLAPGANITPQNFDTDNAPAADLFRLIAIGDPPGIPVPTDLATCLFALDPGGTQPVPSDFVATFVVAQDTTFQLITPEPDFYVASIACQTGPTTTTTLPVPGCVCGDPVLPLVGALTQRLVNATDALFALRAGVGAEACELCACDVNDTGAVNATDALLILQFAVGQPVVLGCPVGL